MQTDPFFLLSESITLDNAVGTACLVAYLKGEWKELWAWSDADEEEEEQKLREEKRKKKKAAEEEREDMGPVQLDDGLEEASAVEEIERVDGLHENGGLRSRVPAK
jgi:hypothetical protein